MIGQTSDLKVFWNKGIKGPQQEEPILRRGRKSNSQTLVDFMGIYPRFENYNNF